MFRIHKYLNAIILGFFIFQIHFSFSQLNPPSLRCINVQNNDVILTWVPTTDPSGNMFSSYEIYSSANSSQNFSPIGTVTAINSNSFVHLGVLTVSNPVQYYFIVSKATINANTSIHSDTLNTMFLNLVSVSTAPDLKIKYNDIHPSHLSTSKSFTIQKEYPIGTWKTIKTSTILNYADTISLCKGDSIYYKIQLADNIGCVSQSNIQGGIFVDTKAPDEPQVDSISVLSNGNVVIGWRIPPDKDINRYEIQLKTTAGTNTPVAVVPGRSNTSYTYGTAATFNNTVGIFVGAIDSCNKSSTFNYSLTTILLHAWYWVCDFKTELYWNDYLSMPGGVGFYKVYFSADGINYKVVTTTTLTSFMHTGITDEGWLYYYVRVFSKDKSISASSNRGRLFVQRVKIPNYVYLANVTVSDNTSVQLNIFVDTTHGYNGVDILRSEDGVKFDSVTFVPSSGTAFLNYADKNIYPSSKNYYYQVRLRDSCGNQRTTSNIAKTILLLAKDNDESIFSKNLKWNLYEGFAGKVVSQKLYRIVDGVQETPAIATFSSDVLTYSDNLENEGDKGSKVEYMLAAEEGTTNPYGIKATSNSNIVAAYIDGGLFIPNSFAPKGLNSKWLPINYFIDKKDYHVRVFNRWGETVFETGNENEGWDGANAKDDIYAYQINYKNARGEYLVASGNIQVFR